MMNCLLVKLNAAGDVVRTTTLLRRLRGEITWITAAPNAQLLDTSLPHLRCLTWEHRGLACDRWYDLVINLEDEANTAAFLRSVAHEQRFGAYLTNDEKMTYTDDSRGWFDMSLISKYGRVRADELKLRNRQTYQELVFGGLGLRFEGEPYVVAAPAQTDLFGDVAIASAAGPVWPMKGWAHYERLKQELEAVGLTVNVLPRRDSVLEHMNDVKNHRCLVGADSLPMHLALATATPCVTLFNCTSPWEIYDYGIQTKIVSPLLERFFYQRHEDSLATTAIQLSEVFEAVMRQLQASRATVSVLEQPS